MREILIIKGLALGVIFLFLGIAFQPIISGNYIPQDDSKQVETKKTIDKNYAKEYLYETIIQIINNPDFKELLEKNNKNLFTSNYDYKSLKKELLDKNPKLYYSIALTRPSYSKEYLNKLYNFGDKIVNIIGIDEAYVILSSISFSDQKFLDELKNIITNDNEINDRISTLDKINLESDGNIIICLMVLILMIPATIPLGFISTICDLITWNHDPQMEKISDLIWKIFASPFVLILTVLLDMMFTYCGPISPPYP